MLFGAMVLSFMACYHLFYVACATIAITTIKVVFIIIPQITFLVYLPKTERRNQSFAFPISIIN